MVNLDALRVGGEPTRMHIDFAGLDGFSFDDGGGFPPSYRDFIRHSGWARTFGLWLVYPPVLPGYADGFVGRGGQLTRAFRAAYRDGQDENFDWMIEPDGSWELVASLTVFGWSENGDALLWDTTARDAHGEFPVWESVHMDTMHRRGTNLAEVLDGLRSRAGALADNVVDIQPLPPTRV